MMTTLCLPLLIVILGGFFVHPMMWCMHSISCALVVSHISATAPPHTWNPGLLIRLKQSLRKCAWQHWDCMQPCLWPSLRQTSMPIFVSHFSQLYQFSPIFLGCLPCHIPALYPFMCHCVFHSYWYPQAWYSHLCTGPLLSAAFTPTLLSCLNSELLFTYRIAASVLWRHAYWVAYLYLLHLIHFFCTCTSCPQVNKWRTSGEQVYFQYWNLLK